jgi:5-methylcytosine-specific restriction endonuclease McrA
MQTIDNLQDILQTIFFQPEQSEPVVLSDVIFGTAKATIQEDFYITIAKWFTQNIYYPQADDKYFDILSNVYEGVQIMPVSATETQKRNLAGVIAKILQYFFARKKRKVLKVKHKVMLLEQSGRRCAICGFPFPPESINRFVRTGDRIDDETGDDEIDDNDAMMKEWVDFLKPITVEPENMVIEIDHVYPVSRGGASDIENLQLTCRYCNRRKKNFISLFDIGYAKPEFFNHEKFGQISYPHGFYVVRCLKAAQCFKCGLSAKETELTVALTRIKGQANPTNLFPTCYNCDPLSENRFVDKDYFVANFSKTV